jgi:hypothetical protein
MLLSTKVTHDTLYKEVKKMKKIGLIILLAAFLSGCGNTRNEEETPTDSIANTEETNDSKTDDTDKEETISFDEWLDSSDLSYKELILPRLDEMSAEEIILHYRSELEVPEEWVSVAYSDFQTEESFYFRENEVLTAASTTKVLLAMLYFDLVEAEVLNFDSNIPYDPSLYQEGGGEITAAIVDGEAQNSYPLDYTIKEMIVRSDNTSVYMLRQFYKDNYGPLGEGLSDVVEDSKYTADMLEENVTTAVLLEETLLALLKSDIYAPIIEYMRLADENLYFKYYIDENVPVKYGLLDEFKHHTEIYEIDGEPVYSLVILTSNLKDEQANEFFGGINLQFAARAQYRNYVNNL